MAKLNISLIDFLNFEEKKLIKDSDLMENGEKVSDLDIIWTWGISQSTAVDYGTHTQASFFQDSIQCTLVTNIRYSPNDQVDKLRLQSKSSILECKFRLKNI